MEDITTQFEECLRRHCRLVKPGSVNYAVALAELGLDSMATVALLVDVEKTFAIRFHDEMLVDDTFRTAGALRNAVELLLRERQTA